jgi:exodeoxyribonuclease V alpha subunit
MNDDKIQNSNILKVLISINHVFYPRGKVEAGDWCAFICSIEELYKGDPQLNKDRLSVSGIVPEIDYYEKYVLIAKFTPHETYGNQYTILCMNKLVNLDSPTEQRVFLEYVLSDTQINSLYEALENPFDVIRNNDIPTLISVKGIGEETAQKIIQRYNDNIGNGLAYVELDSFGLTKYMIDKLIETYGSADIAVQKIQDNPYILIEEVDGIGWKKADEMALNAGMGKESKKRISACIVHLLKTLVEEGDTWTTPQELIDVVFEMLDISDTAGFREVLYILQENNIICWDEEKTKISLTQYYELENSIARHLHRLLSCPNDFKLKNSDFAIKEIEEKQGFNFTEEQLQAIKSVVGSQVSIITGGAGTGKSTVVSGVLQILKDLSFAQTALSGRAASRLSEITHEDGYTIHRLLDYHPVHGFRRNENNPLKYNIIILDEISMVGAELFYSLIQAIPNGSKLIMIGDDGQLESIGLCNIFKDMLNSEVIPVARLTKIHRQAAKSAIITESVKVRNHEQLVSHKWVGNEVRGELQDLELNIYEDSILSQKKIIEKFTEIYENRCSNINDIQIVVPMRYKGDIATLALNKIVQNIVNPFGKNEIQIIQTTKGDEIEYKLREGDKVIITKNNYKTLTVDGECCSVFNGNKGIIESIDKSKKEMIIDFEQYGKVIIAKKFWRDVDLGYALTCHKLQGSEADNVIIGLDYTARGLLTKEWLYTAITRAKKYCVLCGETNALTYCITNSNIPYKRTFLKEMLQNYKEA